MPDDACSRLITQTRRREEATAEAGAAVEHSVCAAAVEAPLPINCAQLGDNFLKLRPESLSSCYAAAIADLRDEKEKAEAKVKVVEAMAAVAAAAVAGAGAAESTTAGRDAATRKIPWREEAEV